MQNLRILAAASLLLLAAAGSSDAARINAPGQYDVNIVLHPSYTPPGLPAVGPDVYAGVVTITNTGEGVRARFRGANASGDKLVINSVFMTGWVGMLLMDVPVGATIVPNAVVGIDVAWLKDANLNGDGLVNGVHSHVVAKFGMGGVVENLKVSPR